MTISSQHRQRAARHAARARNYRRQAQLLLEREGDLDCAAALIYEAAKQCINAVANQQGRNPGPTGGKERFLYRLAEQYDAPPDLVLRWNYTDQLHIYADREHLSRPDFMDAWAWAQSFIDDMLGLYAGRG